MHSSLLRGRRLRTATQQHGYRDKVLRRPPEEQQGVSVGVDVSTHVGVLVIVACRSSCRRRWCAAPWLLSSRAALTSVAIPLTGLPLHREILCRSSVAGLGDILHRDILGEEGQAPRRAGASPSRARQVAAVVGRQWRGPGSGSELLDVEDTQSIPVWDHTAAWFVSSKSS
jgi:hypothetical protein